MNLSHSHRSLLNNPHHSKSKFNIETIHAKIQSGEAKCSEIVDHFLERAYNKNLYAIISYNPTARLDAKYLDKYYEIFVIFVRGISKIWSQYDLPTPQISAYLADNAS